eukprot:scaffold216305_cov36-Prasinocladus_malaysianus.AAC.1
MPRKNRALVNKKEEKQRPGMALRSCLKVSMGRHTCMAAWVARGCGFPRWSQSTASQSILIRGGTAPADTTAGRHCLVATSCLRHSAHAARTNSGSSVPSLGASSSSVTPRSPPALTTARRLSLSSAARQSPNAAALLP